MEAISFDFRPLRDGQFRRLFSAEATSLIGDFALLPVIPYAVFELGGSAGDVALVFAAEYVASVPLVLFGGVVGDRFPRRSVMIAADVSRFGALALMAILFFLGEAAIWQLVAVQLALGAGSAFFGPALNGIVPDTVEEALQAANSLRTVSLSSGQMIGPAIGGIFLLVGTGWAFALDALTFLLSAVLLSGLRGRNSAEPELGVWQGLKEGWIAFRERTWLWTIVAGFALLNAAVFAPFFILGPLISDGSSAWSTILVSVGVGAVIGAILGLGWHPERPLLVAVFGLALWVPLAVLLGADVVGAPIAIAGAAGGCGQALFATLWNTAIQSQPKAQVSRLSSYDWLGSFGFLPLGYAVAALAAETIGPQAGILLGALVLTVVSSWFLLVKSIRTYPAPASGEAVARELPAAG